MTKLPVASETEVEERGGDLVIKLRHGQEGLCRLGPAILLELRRPQRVVAAPVVWLQPHRGSQRVLGLRVPLRVEQPEPEPVEGCRT